MGAWLLQPAAALRSGDRPLTSAKLRFRDPLYAGEAALLSGSVGASGNDADLRTRVEYMYQSFENSEFDTNEAIIFQISYGKRF